MLLLSLVSAVSIAGQLLVANGNLIDTMKHDIFVVTGKTFDAQITTHRNTGVAAVAYYNTDDKAAPTLLYGMYNDVAKELRGMAKIAAMDCSASKAFCKSQNLSKLPTVVIYPPHPFPLTPYTGEMTTKALMNAITRLIPGDNIQIFANTTSKVEIDKFLTTNIAVPKVVLFSDKPKAPVLFKAVSNSFHDRMSFGFVNKDVTEFITRFKVVKFPTLMIFTGTSTTGKGEVYEGAMKFGALHAWLNVRSETFVKGGGYSSHETVEDEKPWLAQEIPEVTRASHQDVCFRHKGLCVIYASQEGELDQYTVDMLSKIQKEYKSKETDRTAKYIFSWFDASIETALAEILGLSDKSRLPSVVIFNPHKRLRFVKLADGVKPTEDEIRILIEKISGGNARFTNVKGQKLPPFAARRATPAPAAKEEL